MRNLHKIAVASAVVAMVGISSPIMAQSGGLSGNVEATLLLTSGCAMGDDVDEESAASFGTLDFGSAPGTFVGELTATVAAGGNNYTGIICSADLNSLKITINGGENAGEGLDVGEGTRALTNGEFYVPYEVYMDSGYAEAYRIGVQETVSIDPSGQSINIPIYGKINKTSANSLPAGTYSDTLEVEIGW